MGRTRRECGLFERRGGYAPNEKLRTESIPKDLYAEPPRDEAPASSPSFDED